jgi:prepilin-type N-terminal cleavage/methylation domain-containing protein
MSIMASKRSGFTIVELLIVIVVIAILATISIVAYTGMQDRAYNSKVIAGSERYLKALLAYEAVYGSYPAYTGCLGANYPNNACWAQNADGTLPAATVSVTLDSALSEFLPTKPEVGTQMIYIVVAPQYRAGLWYRHNDATYGHRLTYYLKGNNTNCALPRAIPNNEGPLTQCNLSLPE